MSLSAVADSGTRRMLDRVDDLYLSLALRLTVPVSKCGIWLVTSFCQYKLLQPQPIFGTQHVCKTWLLFTTVLLVVMFVI